MTLKCDHDLESAKSRILHIVSLRGTFELCLTKTFQSVQKIWSGREIEG